MRRLLRFACLPAIGLVLGLAPLRESSLAARDQARSVWNGDIYVVNADGTGWTRLTRHPAEEFDPAWSPDGEKIAFSRFIERRFQIFVMNADGTDAVQLTRGDAAAFDAAWSPDGRRIAFTRCAGACHIYVMNADGSGVRILTEGEHPGERAPTWSHDGGRIAFGDVMGIAVVDADGGNWHRLTDGPSNDSNPAWSPTGKKVAFDGSRGLHNGDIYVVLHDGSESSNVTDSAPLDSVPSWSPEGSRIAFMRKHNKYYRARLFVMSADGSAQTSLRVIGDAYSRPSWSPDGTRLAYSWLAACLVPKLAGVKLNDARARLRLCNCSVGRVRLKASARPRGTVVAQRPRGHVQRAIGTRVNLVVSAGR